MTALTTLLEHAEGERDRALAALRRAEEQLRRVQAQADQLCGYRADYRQRWGDQFSRLGAIEIVHCYQTFSGRLDQALQQQQQQAEGSQAQCQRLRTQLVAAELRVASVRTLMERRQRQLHTEQRQREQRAGDDAAQQRRWTGSVTASVPL